MAAANPARALQEELFCPICLDYFAEPVVLNCEHNFCRACIGTYWDSLEDGFPCPQCRRRSHGGEFRPNIQLGRVAEKAKELARATASPERASPASEYSTRRKPEAGEEKCQLHHEALKLFCKEDQALICVICDRSKEHRLHTVIPVEEAAEEDKAKLQHLLAILKSERNSREILAINHGKKLEILMSCVEAEKQRTAHVFQQLRKTLQDRENHILQGLSEVIKDLKKMQQENNSKVQQGAPLLQGLILELEQTCHQPDVVFLKEAGSLLNRCKSWKFPKWTPVSTTGLEEQISHFSHKKTFLWEYMTEMPEILTLDPQSAHVSLMISADRKTVSHKDACWIHRNSPKRFDPSFCVLGSEGFTSGRHHWLVDVRGQCGWALGVACESVDRKKPVVLQPEHGIWAVELGPSLLFPARPASVVKIELPNRRIRVSLDYEAGWLAFTDNGNQEPLFTFRTSFTEKLYPFFWLWSPEASLTLCS